MEGCFHKSYQNKQKYSKAKMYLFTNLMFKIARKVFFKALYTETLKLVCGQFYYLQVIVMKKCGY